MLTTTELHTLEQLVARARRAAGRDHTAALHSLTPGDVVQLRPGACHTWETSLLLVCQVTPRGRIRGPILRPHRGGCREAWWEYSAPELARIGRTHYPEPAATIRAWCFAPPCPLMRR